MSTRNICLHKELTNIIFQSSSNMIKYRPYQLQENVHAVMLSRDADRSGLSYTLSKSAIYVSSIFSNKSLFTV